MQAVVPTTPVLSKELTMDEFLCTPMGIPYADLTNATMVDVLVKYEEHQRQSKPSYTNSAVVSLIIKWQSWHNGYILMPLRVDEMFYTLFYKEVREKTEISVNTLRGYIGMMATALEWGSKNRCPVSPTYKSFHIDKEPTLKVALTSAELAHIYFFDLKSVRVPRKRTKITYTPIYHEETRTKVKRVCCWEAEKIPYQVARVAKRKVHTKHLEWKRCGKQMMRIWVNKVFYYKELEICIKTKNGNRHRVWRDKVVECKKKVKEYLRTEEPAIELVPLRADHIANLERVKDMIVFLANTMQRYSDAKRITRANFSADGMTIYVTQQKTGNKAVVNIAEDTILPKVFRQILQKYDYCAPYNKCINRFNVLSHELIGYIGGEFAEDIISIEVKRDGEIVRKQCKKGDKITSHCGRRTGITNLIEKDVQIYNIMKKSGHSNMESVQHYDLSREKINR